MKVNITSGPIARPPAKVFAFLADQRNEDQWHTDVLEARLTSAEPIGLGTQFWVRMKPFMGMSEATSTVSEYEPDRRVAHTVHMGKLTPVSGYTIDPDGRGGCRVTKTVELEPAGLMRLIAPMMKSMIRKANVQFLVNLKRVLEAG
jgi:uncharacterized protein YndB with AHSA1/START domain